MEMLTQDGSIVITKQQFLDMHPDKYFPTPVPYADFGWFVIAPQGQPTYDPITQTVLEGKPLFDGNHWLQTWEVFQLNPATVATNQERQKNQSNQSILEQILVLQQKALRSLVEDSPDTTWLDKYKDQIKTLRSQIQ